MAISKLVTGTPFERPAITFSTKSADSNLQKASSSLLTTKSSMGDLADSMSRLNIQLTQLQKVSNEIVKSIASVLKTIAKVDRDMTGRFRTLNKELAASRTEFTRSLAYITPSLTGGAGATISAAALGPAAAANDPTAIVPSGNSVWDGFMAFVKIRAAGLFLKIGARALAAAAGLAVPGIGWIATAVTLLASAALAWELYELWCEYKKMQPDPAEKNAADALQNKQQATPPVGAPQGTQLTDMSMSGETGAFAAAAGSKAKGGAGAPQGGTAPSTDMSISGETGSFDAARQSAAAPQPMRRPSESTPTDMSIGGETGTFGASAQAATAPQPMRRPADAVPTKAAGAPAMTPPDPHAKSKAMFQQQQEMERNGDSGATAMFFAADQQRQKELAGLKAVAAAPGAPVEAKKAAAKSLRDATNPATFGRGGGHTTGETTGAIGRGGGDHTDPRKLGRGAGSHTLPTDGLPGGDTGLSERDIRAANMQNASNNMQKEYDAKDRLAPIQDPMAEMARKMEEAKRIGALQDRQAIDDKDVADAAKYKPLEQQRAAIDSGAAKPATPTQAKRATVRNMTGPEGNAENPPPVPGAPAASAPAQGPPPAPEGDESAGYKGKLGKILQQNFNDYNVMNKSAGGDQNVTPNLPLSADNPLLISKFRKQHMQNHQ